jgi:uncharacterized protein
MPEYLSPGVYVEEVDAGPKPIEGVSTSTAGAVGVTARGPTWGKPELVTSFAEFQRKFGGIYDPPDAAVQIKWNDPAEGGHWWRFPLSVQGFFENGGQRLYVKRVFAASATAAGAELEGGLVIKLAKDVAAGSADVSLESLIGIEEGTTIKLVNATTNASGPARTVVSYDSATFKVTLDQPVAVPYKQGKDFVEVMPRQAPKTLGFTARDRGEWASPAAPEDGLFVYVRPMVGATYVVLADPSQGSAVDTTTTSKTASGKKLLEVDSVAGLAAGDHVSIAGQEYTLAAATAGAPSTIELDRNLGAELPTGSLVRKMRKALPAGTQIAVWGGRNLYKGAIVEVDNGEGKEITTVDVVAGDTLTLSNALTTQYHEGHKLRVVEAQVLVEHRMGGEVLLAEAFGNLRLVDDKSPSYLVEHINQRSKLVTVARLAGYSESELGKFPASPTGGWLKFAGGDDDIDNLSPDDFVGEDGGSGKRTGIAALEDIDEISICVAPNMWAGTIHAELISHCEILKDRFAILDPADGLDIEGIRSFREPIDTKYAAIYYPWLNVRSPREKKNVHVAPSAHMAGIYARVDNERGVHKAPANEVVRGIDLKQGFADDVTKREQDMLNPKGINALRYFPGRGYRVWGARTLSSDASWKYINVRRLFIFVEESIDEGTQWAVFEPNDRPLWARIRQTVANFLTSQWRTGALQGKTAEEAFFVRCDESTMTQDDIDNGRLICVIGIAPVKPAEFVIFRIQQKTLELAT